MMDAHFVALHSTKDASQVLSVLFLEILYVMVSNKLMRSEVNLRLPSIRGAGFPLYSHKNMDAPFMQSYQGAEEPWRLRHLLGSGCKTRWWAGLIVIP